MTTEQKIIKTRVGVLELAKQLGNVARACRIMGYSRDSFYRVQGAVRDRRGGGAGRDLPAQADLKNRMAPEVEAAVVALAIEELAWGQVRVANELAKRGRIVSAAGVRCIWQRHDQTTMKHRLKALEAKVARDGRILTRRRWPRSRRRRPTRKRTGSSRASARATVAPRTRLRGTLKGVGRIYQQTFIDTYAKIGFAQLYDRKTPLTAADLLNDRVLPFCEGHAIPLSRVLTDRGTEYCGVPDHYEYELYLAVENIDHTRTKAESPQTNAICERFHKTMLNEFDRVAFRKKIYADLEGLQADLDAWLTEYNEARPHQGRWCYGKTPMQTFLDSVPLAKEKLLVA